MDLDTVIQSEVTQKEENKYHILIIYVEPRKMVQMNQFARQKQRHRCGEQTDAHQEVGGGGGMNWEIGIDIYTLICIKQITN